DLELLRAAMAGHALGRHIVDTGAEILPARAEPMAGRGVPRRQFLHPAPESRPLTHPQRLGLGIVAGTRPPRDLAQGATRLVDLGQLAAELYRHQQPEIPRIVLLEILEHA